MTRTIWDEGAEPGGRVVSLAVALALSVAVIESLLDGHIGLLFDVCFVVICVGVALLVHPRDFFAIGVLPPLLMLGIFVLFAVSSRDGLGSAQQDGFLQSVVSALGRHAIALFVGYALALACLLVRRNRINQGWVSQGSETSPPHPPARPQVSPPTSR